MLTGVGITTETREERGLSRGSNSNTLLSRSRHPSLVVHVPKFVNPLVVQLHWRS